MSNYAVRWFHGSIMRGTCYFAARDAAHALELCAFYLGFAPCNGMTAEVL